ncbi:hypothetical protein SAMN04488040_2124 [Sulfitobacter marinus]|uniref:Glucosyl transferase GtrII n=1 Tax=Sulfitobacter marinus TaxID=394264 RepID=A0A1I6T947_9RHOB|nr:hypothetical protein [Sulfitobacter marinus]SFS85700.1 hypothetical protein SAMN04488040_2124 [Sulfitobacter marinus]
MASALNSNSVQLWPTFLVAFIAVMLMSAMNLADPMIRHDDYPALFGDAAMFWNKTLHEGRWLNYIWHLRPVITPSWVNFALYQGLWALVVSSIAVATSGPKGTNGFTVLMALMLMVSPSAMLISPWFNTLTPGLAVVALYGLLACKVSNRMLRTLLPGFAIVSFMSYTTYPLLLLATCIARTEHRTLRDLAGLLMLFCVSFIAAVLVVYALNWQVHGVFGVPVADWRQATSASGMAGIIDNLPKLRETFQIIFHRNAFGFWPLILFFPALSITSFAILLKRRPMEALYILAGLTVGIALVIVQVLKIGVIVPPRAFVFMWVFAVMAIVRAVETLGWTSSVPSRLGRNAIMLIIGVYFIQVFLFYGQFRAWQAETRAIAQDIEPREGPIFIYGNPMRIASGQEASIQSREAFSLRLRQLTGREAINCDTDADACPARPDLGVADQGEIHLRYTGSDQFVIFTPPEGASSDRD